MKISKKLLNKIIAEERIRAIVESKIPWSRSDFFHLLNEAMWWEKLDPKSTAYKIAMAAKKEWDDANEKQWMGKNPKNLGMSRDDYMKAQVHANATAGHKFARWNPYEREGSLPDSDYREGPDIIRKGYPEEGLVPRKATPMQDLQKNVLGLSDKARQIYGNWIKNATSVEVERYISPFGYMHSLVSFPDRFGKTEQAWIYSGDYAIDEKTGKASKTLAKRTRSYYAAWPKVNNWTLHNERNNPSPDADAMLGKDKKGSIDIQDPTMEEQLIAAIQEELATAQSQ